MHINKLRNFLFFLLFFCFYESNSQGFEFIENKGQWNAEFKYKAAIPSGFLYLEENAFTFHLYDSKKLSHYNYSDEKPFQNHAFQFEFLNSHFSKILPSEKLIKQNHFFLGKNPNKWKSNLSSYKRALYKDIYPNIDLEIDGTSSSLKYNFIVKKNGNVADISIKLKGVDNFHLQDGILFIHTEVGQLIERKPFAYQIINGEKYEVDCSFNLENDVLSYSIGRFSKNHTLVIDPVLIFSTYSGSFSTNYGHTACYDSEGHLYAGGIVFGPDYPVTLGAFQDSLTGGGFDMAISKYDKLGKTLLFSSYLGGSRLELPLSLITDDYNNLYVLGASGSDNYPISGDAFDTTFNTGASAPPVGLNYSFTQGSDIVISRLSSDGSNLLGSTFLGGTGIDGLNYEKKLRYNYSDEFRGEIELDSDQNVYIVSCTGSSDFPLGNKGYDSKYDGLQDGIIAKLSQNLDSLYWATYHGGSDRDAVYSVAIDSKNDIYVTGGTTSDTNSFKSFSNPWFPIYMGGRSDAYVSKISKDGDLLESTNIGGNYYEQSYFVEVDKENNVYLFGQTESPGLSFIVNVIDTAGSYINQNGGQFVMKLNQDLSTVIWSTKFGKDDKSIAGINPNISPTAFSVDLCNSIYLSGWGGPTNKAINNNNSGSTDSLFITSDAWQDTTDGQDFYLMVLSDDANYVKYASYYGGPESGEHVDGGTSRFDKKGKIYQSVCGGCDITSGGNSDFPIFPDTVVSKINNAVCNNAVFKIDFLLPIVAADFSIPERICKNDSLLITNTSLIQKNPIYNWTVNGVYTSSSEHLHFKSNKVGAFEIGLAIFDSASCNLIDTVFKTLTIQGDTTSDAPIIFQCKGDTIEIGKKADKNYNYKWITNNWLADTSSSITKTSIDKQAEFILLLNDGICVDSIIYTVIPDSAMVQLLSSKDTILCDSNQTYTLLLSSKDVIQNYHWSSNRLFSDTLQISQDSSFSVQTITLDSTFYVRAFDNNNCVFIDSLSYKVNQIHVTGSPNQYLCKWDSMWLKANIIPRNTIDSIYWIYQNSIIGNQDSLFIDSLIEGNIKLGAISDANCQDEYTLEIKRSVIGNSNIYISSNLDTIYSNLSAEISINPDIYNYLWEPAQTLNNNSLSKVLASPKTTTEYLVTISDPQNIDCKIFKRYTIVVEEINCNRPEIIIPNAFSPNDDGLNDEFRIIGNRIQEIHLEIFNRWGEKVFESNQRGVGWDGSFKGKESDPGVFVYQVQITCINEDTFFEKGNITLLR